MTLESEARVFRIHPVPVVFHSKQLLPSELDRDRHTSRVRIKRVFDQLFDDRSGPLDNFAGSDLVREM
jgi:hypothetical protein